jgi:alpha-glucosidase
MLITTLTKTLLAFSLLFLIATPGLAGDTISVKSPDGKVAFMLFQRDRELYFSVSLSNRVVVAASPMELSVNGTHVTKDVVIKKAERYSHNETYPVYGAHSTAKDACNGILLSMSPGDLTTALEIRAFNTGIAFHFEVTAPHSTLTPEEKTIFNLPTKSTLWYHDLNSHYEGVHVKKQIDSVHSGEWVAPPATFELPGGGYGSITEAGLLGYPGMALQANGKNGLAVALSNEQPTSYPFKLRYSPEDTLRMRQPAKIQNRIVTPWRVVIIGADLNALVNSDVITNLNSAPDPGLFPQGLHTSWVKPGRAVWKYLNGGGDGSVEVARHFTDGAAALGFEHNILEGFWTKWTDAQLKELADYSRQKGVGIWLWKHSKSLRTPEARDSFFSKCWSLGITGAKIDFFDNEAKEVIDEYDSILIDAARYHILLDFHGANKPTGLARTFPNSLTYEAVKGMESSKLEDRATHETTIPFTRCLAGPAEYTVMLFNERRRNTTWAHQVASAAILNAPLLTYAANPDTILENPAVNIIKSIPATWDETIVLPPSEIGKLAVYARRKGEEWFLAVMNGVTPGKIKIPLSFLNGKYSAVMAKDGPSNDGSMIVEQKKYSREDILELNLVSGGGFIAKFSK